MTKTASAKFIAAEESSQRLPVELYHFWRVGGTHWRYTDGDVAVVYDSDTYTPATINRGGAKYDAELDVSKLTISASHVTTPIVEYLASNPVEVIWITVMKLHRDMSPLEVSVVFIGQIKSVTFKGSEARITCVGFEHYLRQPVPTFRYQIICNNTLYDDFCTMDKDDWDVSAVVTVSGDGLTLTSATFGTKTDDWFKRGHITWGDYHRMIIGHTGNDISLRYPIVGLETGQTVIAYAGCNKLMATCNGKFNNLLNIFATPYIPVENPSTWTGGVAGQTR
jgi:uncharacterized phage protein (TIGR02218 family)